MRVVALPLQCVGPLPRALFRCPHLAADRTGADACGLPDAPHAAQHDLLERLLSRSEAGPVLL